MKLNQFLRERMLGDIATLYDMMLFYDQAARHGDYAGDTKDENELCARIDFMIDIINIYRSYLQERWAQQGCVPWYAPEVKKEGLDEKI